MSSLIDRIKARMAGLDRPLTLEPEKREKTRHTIRANRWDERVWDAARQSESVDKFIYDLSVGDTHHGGEREGFDGAPELVRDLFMGLYKAAPILEKKRHVEREVYGNRAIMKEVLDNPKLKDLQEFTANDPVLSTVGVNAMEESIREIISRMPPPPPPPSPGGGAGQPGQGQGQPGIGLGAGAPGQDSEGQGEKGSGAGKVGGKGQDHEQQQDAEEEEGDGSGGQSEAESEGEGESLESDGGAEFDPEQEMEDAEHEWEETYDALLDDLDLERAMDKALTEANKEANELDNLRKGIGLDDGEWQSMSPEERMAMATQLQTPEMKELASVVGRMRRFALGVKATRVNDVPHEAYDVETGDNIKRMLKAEFALLSTEETSFEFYRRLFDREMLQFKMRGKEEVGKGPIVIAIDKSGSMSGQPFRWAMGVAEALRRFAQEEDRDYYAMFFGANNDRHRFDFPKGGGPFKKVLEFLSCVANGGTQFDGVLTEALDKAQNAFDGEAKGKADIVFITDGQAHLDDTWIDGFNKDRERVGVRVYSIYIGGARDMARKTGPVALLERISDAVIPVSDLTPQAAQLIFQKV